MRRLLIALSASAVLFAPSARAGETCGYGTRIDFEDTPKEAAARAAKEQKLVLVLHVSGHFEDPRFT